MEMELSIQQVAELTQLSTHTLRYYERMGLLDPISRAANGHRRYSRYDIAWIDFLMRLRSTGMPIREMQKFADLRRQGNHTCVQRRCLLEAHQQRIAQQLNELENNSKVLEKKIHHYRALEKHDDADP